VTARKKKPLPERHPTQVGTAGATGTSLIAVQIWEAVTNKPIPGNVLKVVTLMLGVVLPGTITWVQKHGGPRGVWRSVWYGS
jgi:hypothetical protein